MTLWQHDETGRMTWADEQPSERWYTVPTMYEDDLRAGITKAEYDTWFASSEVIEGVRMGPRDLRLTKTHDKPRIIVLDKVTPDFEWIVGYLPGGGALFLECEDCRAQWDGRRAVWSVEECDKSRLI